MIHLKKYLKNNYFYFFAFCFAIIFIFSINVNYNADEYNYSFITWSQTRISSLYDILQSQKLLYFNWTGRILVHSLIQILLFIPKYFYAILNSLVFCAFIYLIISISNFKHSLNKVLLSTSLIVLLIPVFGETCIWISGSINYLWPSVLFLLLINLLNSSKKLSLILLIAFLAGVSQEIVLVGGFIYLLFNLFTNKFEKRFLLIFLSFLLGGILLISSPGNFLRASSSTENMISTVKILKTLLGGSLFLVTIFINLNIKDSFFKFIDYLKNKRVVYIFEIISFIFFILFLIFNFIQKSPDSYILVVIYQYKFVITILFLYIFIFSHALRLNGDTKIFLDSFNYLSIGLTSSLAMGVMPEFPSRSLFLSCSFMIISVLKLYSNFKINILNIIVIPLAAIIFSISLKFYIFDLNSWNKKMTSTLLSSAYKDTAIVEIQPKAPFLIRNYYRNEPSAITNSPNSITNFYCAKYYNINNIIGVVKNTATIKIEKENIDAAHLAFEYTNKNGERQRIYAEQTLLEESRNMYSLKQAYFSIPLSAEDVTFINDSSVKITADNITTYSLD